MDLSPESPAGRERILIATPAPRSFARHDSYRRRNPEIPLQVASGAMKHGRRPAGIRHRSAYAGSASSPTAHPAANGAPPLAATRHPAPKCLCVLVHGTLHWFRDNSALSRRGFAGPLLDLNSRRLPGLGALQGFLERRWRPASDERRGSRRDGTPSKRRPSRICA